ncbi:MAG TPA: hypothetical protein VMX17_13570 [Candidatus Glassbacteria bacterium]|nr:hypothetical protein [Candidatus Glassbacteria bacterium]
MYRYKLKTDTRIWLVFDKDMNLDPYDFFSSRNVEHWTHTNDEDGSIDLYWPKINEDNVKDNVVDTICPNCNYWYSMPEGEKVSQCQKCGSVNYD